MSFGLRMLVDDSDDKDFYSSHHPPPTPDPFGGGVDEENAIATIDLPNCNKEFHTERLGSWRY